jgi:hypothetical protein
MNVIEVIGVVTVYPVMKYTLCNFGNTYIRNSGVCLVGKVVRSLCASVQFEKERVAAIFRPRRIQPRVLSS